MDVSNHPLRVWRLEQKPKVSQTGLAEMVGMLPSHVSQLENWQKSVSLAKAVKIAEVTKGQVPVAALIQQAAG